MSNENTEDKEIPAEVERKDFWNDEDSALKPNNSKIIRLIQEKSSKTIKRWQEKDFRGEFPQWHDASNLRDAASKPVSWAVNNLWTRQAKILLAAEQKTGKTFVICHIAMCVAAELRLFNCSRFDVLDPGPVGIVAGEDDEGEIARRLDRMFRAMGLLMSNFPIHFLSAHNLRLNRERDQHFMRESVDKLGLRLIIYDPLARLMDGDENSKESVASVLNPASSLAKDKNVSVLVVHHLGKQNTDTPRTAIARVRGSSDITSWFSCGLFLSGNMRLGRVTMEVVQRTSGDVPNEFPIDIKENQEQSEYGLGSMRMIAKLNEDEKMRSGRNEQMIDDAADEIYTLVQRKGSVGVTYAEINVHLGIGANLMTAAIKKLIRENGVVRLEKPDDFPHKVLVPTSDAERKRFDEDNGY
jgi:hypothetical protein